MLRIVPSDNPFRQLFANSAPKDETLRGFELRTFSSEDIDKRAFTEYSALSYVWGDPTITKPIEIEGKILNVTTNLYEALSRLLTWPYGRKTPKAKWIWIDAVCINQSDVTERGHQVQQMANIYKRASRVIIWLGEADAAAERVGKRLKHGSLTESLEREHFFLEDIASFLRRPWFRRIWVSLGVYYSWYRV